VRFLKFGFFPDARWTNSRGLRLSRAEINEPKALSDAATHKSFCIGQRRPPVRRDTARTTFETRYREKPAEGKIPRATLMPAHGVLRCS